MARESRKIWAARVAAWRASGKTAREYADGIGVNASTLSNWGWKLQQAGKGPSEARRGEEGPGLARDFVELFAPPELHPPESRFEVVLRSGHQVRVPATFDERALSRLVNALEVA